MLKMPMIYVDYIPEGYEIDVALYNKTYDMLNVDLVNNEQQSIYILQQYQYDELTSGIANEEIACDEVRNSNIEQKIVIYRSIQDNGYSFNVVDNHMLLAIRCNTSLEECKKIAESIKYY